MQLFHKHSRSKVIGLCGILHLGLGSVVAYGWIAGHPRLLTAIPTGAAMSWTSAIAFIGLGLGFLSLASRRHVLSCVVGVFVAALGFNTLIELCSGHELAIVHAVMLKGRSVGPFTDRVMAINTATCFLLVGIGLVLASQKNPTRGRLFIQALIGAIVSAIGVVSLVGYVCGINSAAGWGGTTGMAFHTAIGHALSGSLIIYMIQMNVRRGEMRITGWLPLTIAAGGITVALLLMLSLRFDSNVQLTRTTDREVANLELRVRERLIDRAKAMQRMSNRGAEPDQPDGPLWERDAAQYVRDFSDLQAVSWVDETNHVRSIIPRAGNERAIGLNVKFEQRRKRAVEHARTTGEFTWTGRIDLVQGGVGMVGISPIVQGQRFGGFYAGVFRLTDLVGATVDRLADGDFDFAILEGREQVYGFAISDPKRLAKQAARRMTIGSLEWDLYAWPTEQYLAVHASLLPEAVGATGSLVSLLLALIVLLVERSREDQCKQKTSFEAANKVLQEYAASAEAATKSKTEFLANMSHEIRTPMTAILGYADLVLDDNALSPDVKELVATIKRNGEQLLAIINDILDLSKIEAGKLVIEQLPYSPRQLVIEVLELLNFRAIEKGLRLDAEFSPTIPRAILTDPTRLRQILLNLVGNAIKFTLAGSVHLRVRWEAPDNSEPMLLVEIHDTGIGMTPEQMSSLFQSFQQADSSMSRQFGGTGLGLAISQRLAQILGGTIIIASEYGTGSTFCVTVVGRLTDLPGNCREGRPSTGHVICESTTPQTFPSLYGTRVLLAEDAPDNQRLLSYLLQREGATVTTAENGRIACDLALEALTQDQPFDVILMDMQMPVLDGYRATGELRDRGYHHPIIALTAHSMPTDRLKCLDAGCNAYLTKPVDRSQFISSIKGWCRDESTRHSSAPTRPASGLDQDGRPDRYAEVQAGSSPPQSDSRPTTLIAAPAKDDCHSIDASEIIRHFEGDEDLSVSLIQIFREHTPQLLTDIQNGIETRNAQLVRRAAHSLKGSIGIFGTTAAFEAAMKLEAAAIQDDFDGSAEAWGLVASTVIELNEVMDHILESRSN